MPTFGVVPLQEAMERSARDNRSRAVAEYVTFLEQLRKGQAGKLEPNEGESVPTIRRRLGAAVRLSGKPVVIKRAGSQIYFWLEGEGAAPRRRGRPRKAD